MPSGSGRRRLQLFQPQQGIRAFIEQKVQDGQVRRESEPVGKYLEIRTFQSQGRQDGIGTLGMDDGAEVVRAGGCGSDEGRLWE